MADFEPVETYDENDVLRDTRNMWLRLGTMLAQHIETADEWIDNEKQADYAMSIAARAEACMWQATGAPPALDVRNFINTKTAATTQTNGDA